MFKFLKRLFGVKQQIQVVGNNSVAVQISGNGNVVNTSVARHETVNTRKGISASISDFEDSKLSPQQVKQLEVLKGAIIASKAKEQVSKIVERTKPVHVSTRIQTPARSRPVPTSSYSEEERRRNERTQKRWIEESRRDDGIDIAASIAISSMISSSDSSSSYSSGSSYSSDSCSSSSSSSYDSGSSSSSSCDSSSSW